MAAFMTLCAVGMHVASIWSTAKKVQTVAFPFNPIISIRETPLYNASRQVVALQLEFTTKNGHEYFFCFDVHDQALRVALLREFPVGTNINRGVCNQARIKMVEARINHRLYLDLTHEKRIFILISTRAIDLRVFAQLHWRALM